MAKELAKIMMNKKAARLYQRMQAGRLRPAESPLSQLTAVRARSTDSARSARAWRR
jgi:hypothetical protein